MDYSSAADVPLGKAFDDVIESDTRGNFMVENSAKCFNLCVPNVTEKPINFKERECLNECFTKSYHAFTLFNKTH
jgi:hypothetical protein